MDRNRERASDNARRRGDRRDVVSAGPRGGSENRPSDRDRGYGRTDVTRSYDHDYDFNRDFAGEEEGSYSWDGFGDNLNRSYTGPYRGDRAFDDGFGRDLREEWGNRGWEDPIRDTETGPYAGRGPKNYRRPVERIREEVCERLSDNGYVDASDIEITVEGDEVTLSGIVESRQMKRIAEDIAASVGGVSDVHNRLRVRDGRIDPSRESADWDDQDAIRANRTLGGAPGRQGNQRTGLEAGRILNS